MSEQGLTWEYNWDNTWARWRTGPTATEADNEAANEAAVTTVRYQSGDKVEHPLQVKDRHPCPFRS